MRFLLIVLKIFYVLDPLLAPILANPITAEGEEVDQNEVLELEKQRMIHREDETLRCGHIKNSLSDRLYDVYAPITDPNTGQYARECKLRKSKNDDVNVVNGEIADCVAHAHLDDDNFVA
ncbi:hypothetical protein Tco_1169854 [Tanacetum coccineum]